MLDYTVNPPTYTINQYVKDEYLSVLTESTKFTHEGYPDDPCYVYKVPELTKATKWLMDVLSINFDTPDYAVPLREITSFTDSELAFYRPFAFLLSCLDGNAFSSEENMDHLNSYMPHAYSIIHANRTGQSQEQVEKELRFYMTKALKDKIDY